MEEEHGKRDSWNWSTFGGWYGNLMQWKNLGISEGESCEDS